MKTNNFKDWTVKELKDTKAYRQLLEYGDDYATELFLSLAGKYHRAYINDREYSLVTLFEWTSVPVRDADASKFWTGIQTETNHIA
jgi:hypothetical protein